MKATLTIDVEFDPEATDAESVGQCLDDLLVMALSTPGITEEYGNPAFDASLVQKRPADDAPDAGKSALYLFDKISGASYHGFGFRQILMNDGEARKAARTLVERLKHHGAKGMDS